MQRNIHDIIAMVKDAAYRRRFLILTPMMVLPVLAVLASLVVPKKFETKMTILVQETAKLNPFLKDLSIGPNLKDRGPALKALLFSEHVLGRVLTDTGRITEATEQKARDTAVKELATSLTMELAGTDVVQFTLKGRTPDRLPETLRRVSERFLERMLSPERTALGESERFLLGQLTERRTTQMRLEDELAAFKTTHADKLPALFNTNVARLTLQRQKLEDKSLELAAATAGLENMRRRLAGTNPMVGRIEEQIVQARSELLGLRSRYTDMHSEVRRVELLLTKLEDERRTVLETGTAQFGSADIDRLWNMAAGVTSSGDRQSVPLLVSQMEKLQDAEFKRASLATEVEQIARTVDEVTASMAEFAPIEQQILRFERSIAQARELADSLAKRYEMARVTGDLGKFEGPERVKIIDEPNDPVAMHPGIVVFLAAGVIGGLVLGSGLAVVTELLDRTLRDPAQFAAVAQVPVLTRVDLRAKREDVAGAPERRPPPA